MPKGVATTRKPRVYSTPATLLNLDKRTKEARLLRETREALTAHVGGTPSATQRVLIDRAAQLILQVALMDRKAATAGGTMPDHDSRQYLAWSNSLNRTLKQLGPAVAGQHVKTLADHIARKVTAP